MKYRVFGLLIFLAAFFSPSPPLPGITIKLASPLPEGTEWDTVLRRMADSWREITEGRVRVKIYPGSIAGSEADMIRKMRFGQLDAGVFTAFGLKSMVPETFVITLPGLIRNDSELDYVLGSWVERFDDRFREEGFELAAWSKTGWAYIFGEHPITIPEDLMRHKLAVDNTETDMAVAFKTLGFQVTPVSIAEIMVSLQSGLVNAFYAPPAAAAGFQWFALAPYMTDYRLAPVISALVLSRRSWLRIPSEYHVPLKDSMAEAGLSFYAESLRINRKALEVMDQNGLERVALSAEEEGRWLAVIGGGHKLMVGKGRAVPRALYNSLQSELKTLRVR